MLEYIKLLVDQMDKEIVICDLNHTILYMNHVADVNYKTRFGNDLIGKNLLDCHNEQSCAIIKEKLAYAIKNNLDSILITDKPEKQKKSYLTLIKDSGQKVIGYYERYEGDAF